MWKDVPIYSSRSEWQWDSVDSTLSLLHKNWDTPNLPNQMLPSSSANILPFLSLLHNPITLPEVNISLAYLAHQNSQLFLLTSSDAHLILTPYPYAFKPSKLTLLFQSPCPQDYYLSEVGVWFSNMVYTLGRHFTIMWAKKIKYYRFKFNEFVIINFAFITCLISYF